MPNHNARSLIHKIAFLFTTVSLLSILRENQVIKLNLAFVKDAISSQEQHRLAATQNWTFLYGTNNIDLIEEPGLLYQELHSADQELLDLLDWEKASLEDFSSSGCAPPLGISRTCCLGTFSAGGGVTNAYRQKCANSLANNLDSLQESVTSFYQNNPLPSRENGTPCDICQIIEVARQFNLTITFLGDSMHAQVWEGLSCELQRRNYHVTTDLFRYNNTGQSVYQNFGATFTMAARSPLWSEEESSVVLKFHLLYLLPVQSHSKPVLIRALAQSDVLVLGFGLHYKYVAGETNHLATKQAYQNAMANLLQRAKQYNLSLIVHRETSAQHFDSPYNGDYLDWSWHKESRNHTCVPHRNPQADQANYWRELAMKKAAQNAGYEYRVSQVTQNMPNRRRSSETSTNLTRHQLVVLPYHNFTQQHYDLHPEIDVVPDCTHYCGSPFLYMPLWRPLRIALDERFH